MPSVAIALDVYPAKVTLPDGAEMTKVRAIVADGKIKMFVTQNGEPHLYYERDVQQIEGKSPIRGVTLTTAEGEITIKKFGGCGCGDKLKTYNPFPGMIRTRVALP